MTCEEPVTLARELPLARKVWELLSPLRVNPDSVNAERHLSNSFQFDPPGVEPHEMFTYSSYAADIVGNVPLTADPDLGMTPPGSRMANEAAPSMIESSNMSLGPTYSSSGKNYSLLSHIRPMITAATSAVQQDMPPEISPGSSHSQQGRETSEFSYASIDELSSRKMSIPEQPHIALPDYHKLSSSPDKSRPRWKVPLPFTSAKRPLPTVSGETSSISSNQVDEQPMEEIPIKDLLGAGLRASARTRAVAGIHVAVSQSSSYALLWSHSTLQLWDLSTSPPSLERTISTESTCILAAVGRKYVAYVMGSRDQKLTVSS